MFGPKTRKKDGPGRLWPRAREGPIGINNTDRDACPCPDACPDAYPDLINLPPSGRLSDELDIGGMGWRDGVNFAPNEAG